MPLYRTLGPVSYLDGEVAVSITGPGVVIGLTETQANELAGLVEAVDAHHYSPNSPGLGTPQSGNLGNCIGYPATQLVGQILNAQLLNNKITIGGTDVSLGGSLTRDQVIGVGSNGLVKRTGANTYVPAVAGTDFQAPLQSPVLSTQSVKTANYTAGVSDLVPVSALGGAVAVTLPAAPADQTRVAVKKIDSSANVVTVVAGGSDTINQSGSSVSLVVQYQSAVLQYFASATTWYVVSTDAPVRQLDARYASASVQRVQLVDNCFARGQNYTSTTAGTYRAPYKVGVSGGDIQVGFGNWYTNGSPLVDTDPGTTVTFSAAFEDSLGNVFQLTFNGQTSVVLPGGGFVLSDPLPIDVVQGDSVFVRVYQSAGTGYITRFAIGQLSSGGGFTATTNLTTTGSGAVSSSNTLMFAPMCVIGTPTGSGRPKSVILQGDSITVGLADGTYSGVDSGYTSAFPGGGYLMRALTGYAGVISEGFSGDSVANFAAPMGHFRRGSLTKYGKFAVTTYGRNDLTGGRTQAQLEADLLTQAYRNLTRGLVGTIVTTITPYTTSTDRWVTTTNQTVVNSSVNTIRIAHNAWVRAGCPIVNGAAVAVGTSGALLAGQTGHPILGYLEVADVVESARDSGKWKAAIRTVADAAITNGQYTLTSATANFTSADLWRDVVIAGAGSAGADLKTQIAAINSTTSVTLTSSASTTVSGQTCVVGPYTFDGLHPATMGNALMAAAVQSPLLALLV